MSVSGTSPRTSTIITNTTSQTSTGNHSSATNTVYLRSGSGGSPSSGDTAADARQGSIGGSSGDASPSSSGGKHKKSTPPKKPNDRESPTMRPRSTSQPVLMVSPLQHKPSQLTLKSQPAPKTLHSPPTSPRALQRTSTVKTETRKPAEPGGHNTATVTLAHTAPTLISTEKVGTSRRPAKEQAAIDIADLVDQHQISASGADTDSEFSVARDSLSPALQKLVRQQKGDTFTLGKLIGLLFGKALADSEGWSNAHTMYVAFKIKSGELNQMLQSGDPRQMNEARQIIETFADSIAGSFFTLSGLEKILRLPTSLVAFLQQVDHRQLRQSLGEAKPPSDPHQLDKQRGSRLANLLIDHCLVPELVTAFSGNADDTALNILRNTIKSSLHTEFAKTAVHALLADSLKHAPDSLKQMFSQWRIQRLTGSTPTRASGAISPRASETQQVRKVRQERKEWLSKQLEWIKLGLHPLIMPDELLQAIRERNREWVGSSEPLKLEVMLLEWQQLATQLSSGSAVEGMLRKLLNDELQKQVEIAEIQTVMNETDLSSLATELLTGQLTSQRARPLSGWLEPPKFDAIAPQDVMVMTDTGMATSTVTSITTTNMTRTTTTTTVTPSAVSMTSTTSAPDPADNASRVRIPSLNLSALQPTDNSPYKPPLVSQTPPVNIRPLPPLPTSAPLSPTVSATVSPVGTPQISPQNSPRSPRKLVESKEGVAMNSLRRKLTHRRIRSESQPPNPIKESPRAQAMKPVTAERLLVLKDYAAGLIKALRASSKDGKLSSNMIKDLARARIVIDVDALSSSLQSIAKNLLTPRSISSTSDPASTAPNTTTTTTTTTTTSKSIATSKAGAIGNGVSHTNLLRSLTGDSLRASHVGSTLLAMKNAVMLKHKGDQLTISKWSDMENQQNLQELTEEAMADEASATAEVSLGQPPSLANSKLPSDLLAIWKEADRLLCEWAAENDLLSLDDVRKARSALGYDLIVTRSILPLIRGGTGESDLVILTWFENAVFDAHVERWNAFFQDFARVVDAERNTISGKSV